MFLYRFLRRRDPQALFCSRDNFQTTFRISFILAGLMAPTYTLPGYILVDFRCELGLEFSNMEFALSQPKMVWLLRKKKQAYQ